MNISNVNLTVSTFSFSEAQNITKEQIETLLNANQELKQSPMKQKLVLSVNTALSNGHVDLYA